jgi:hypothetical protein
VSRRSLEHWASGVTAGAALLLQSALPAFAEPPGEPPPSQRAPAEILVPAIEPLEAHNGWLGRSFHLQKSAGFGYTQHFHVSDHDFVFKVQGPVLRKQKALGLTFKIRF